MVLLLGRLVGLVVCDLVVKPGLIFNSHKDFMREFLLNRNELNDISFKDFLKMNRISNIPVIVFKPTK